LIVDPGTAKQVDIYKLMIGGIVPRPIAFVSTMSPEGALNLAPFSFFNAIGSAPPMICFTVGIRAGARPDPSKDTLRNIVRTGEFVVNLVSEEIAGQMNLTSGEYPPEIDEFALAGLSSIPSDLVKPPRVKESPFQMECKRFLTVEVSALPGGGTLVLGEVLRFHVDDAIVDGFKIDPDKLRAIGRMGGTSYARTRDRFDMIRPK
jgi:flavin reductase (DIM6/NTAB) family NADH-FMN oxidoreductase RutF